ncbi:DUF2147 domain-containing protein [Winogradskyella psychrotolerans]|uniref:DUF2147 domain-containing protein n=1 Tax=Winogradskyella psychrotolerans TaxID=1344585 RepID=UPI001C065FE2|nr:DUF2147 domain-containing protein [Winogradskyella psychrotolerans]MBU2920725.1 DUF2147 domain-containing protein [Winogradskyella psychrotolerans]
MLKKYITSFVMLLLFCSLSAQSITGKWKTIDDNTGQAKSIVEIYESEGKIYGKIIELIKPKVENPICTECKGKNKDKPIVGLQIIDGLTKDDDVYNDGEILNPENGKVYKCQLKLDDNNDTLQVRGYIAFFYKTQYWKRIK